jgi:N6-adenosine-specific RNA methylase IME4
MNDLAASMKYRTIVADPPWPYPAVGGNQGAPGASAPKKNGNMSKSARLPYPTLRVQEIAGLQPPVEDNAHLYLWTTNRFMDDAFDVVRAWGFMPKTILTWTKVHQDDSLRVSMKVGYYFRGATEHCIFGVRGSLRTTVTNLPTGYLWPRLPHSVKPEAFYDLVESVPPGPYLELFARRNRLGWDTWGNESLEHIALTPQGNDGTF